MYLFKNNLNKQIFLRFVFFFVRNCSSILLFKKCKAFCYSLYLIQLINMGNQVCCDQKYADRELTPEYLPVKVNRVNLTPGGIYSLTPQAQTAYDKLKQMYNNCEFLNLPSQASNNSLIENRTSFYKLNNLNAYYCGEWKGDTPEGRGRIIFSNGSMLIGFFQGKLCNYQQCFFIFKDGSYYHGAITNSKLSGNGKLINAKVEYEGEWQDGKPHGQGVQTFSNGDKFIGSFENGKKSGPNCFFKWHDHQIFTEYTGAFYDNKICGQGKLTLKKGTVIEGVFDDNSIIDATCTNAKLRCHGIFIKGKLEGKGQIQFYNRDKYEGHFKGGQLHGKCFHTDEKSRKNECFIFKGRELRDAKGLSDQQMERILDVIDNVYKTVKVHSEALKKINIELNKEYVGRFVQPYEKLFESNRFLIVQIYQQTLLVESKSQH